MRTGRHLRVIVALYAILALVHAGWLIADASTGARAARTVIAAAVVASIVPLALVARRASGALVEASERARQTLEASGEWMWAIDVDWRVTSSNAGVEDVLGWTADRVVGTDAMAVIHPDERPRVAAMLNEVLAAGRGWQGWVVRLRHADGAYRYAQLRATPVRDRRGRVVGYRGSARDVTEEVLRQEVRRARLQQRNDKERRIHDVLVERVPLRITFQPIVDTRSGRPVGYEALSRFVSDPDRPPNEWFAEADEIGLGRAVEIMAIRRALEALTLIPAPLYLSINVSPATVIDPEFLDLVLGDGLPADRIVVEITEHATIEDYAATGTALTRLRDHGIRLAVDDAGAGYSSLQHILRLRPDIVKLDRSITHGIDHDPVRRSLTIALVSFSYEVAARVVAEGVETEGELRVLADSGVPCAQGYHLGRPGDLPTPRGGPIGMRTRRTHTAGRDPGGSRA